MSGIILPDSAVVEMGPGRTPQGLLDECIGENMIGGPLSGRDVRMILDREGLERLLDIAKQSLTGRVVLNGVGIKQ